MARKTRIARKSHKKRRQTKRRSQKGGSEMQRIQKNVIRATKLSNEPETNLYYSSIEENIRKGVALVIAPRYGSRSDAEIKAAKYPYEECLFFFSVYLSDDGTNSYPNAPPQFIHQTPFFKNYRLHPNLYEHAGTSTYSGKVCLGILGTWGNNDWNSSMNIADVLQGIMGILEANPGTYEPSCGDFTDKYPKGILYNQHVMYESIETTCKAYEMVINCVKADSTANSIGFNNSKVKSEKVPAFLEPFLEPLAKRAYSALGYLSGKIDEFIRVNGKSSLYLSDVMHHSAKTADFAKLKECLEATKAKIPAGLRKNTFKYGLGETWRALYEMSKPKRNGKNMTYEEFAEEMIQQDEQRAKKEKNEKAKELGVTSCPVKFSNGSSNENEYEYEYSNEGNLDQLENNLNNIGENE